MFLLLSVNQLDEYLHVFVLCTNVISKVDVVLLLRPIGGDCLARGGVRESKVRLVVGKRTRKVHGVVTANSDQN